MLERSGQDNQNGPLLAVKHLNILIGEPISLVLRPLFF